MTTQNLRRLVDKLSLLEGKTRPPGLYTSGGSKILWYFSLMDLTSKDKFLDIIESVNDSAESYQQITGAYWSEIRPMVNDFKEQLEFYRGFAEDILNYFQTHRIDLTEEEALSMSKVLNPPYPYNRTTSYDPMGLHDSELKGVFLERCRRQLNFLLGILKSRGVTL